MHKTQNCRIFFGPISVYPIGWNKSLILNRPQPLCAVVRFTDACVFEYNKYRQILEKIHFLAKISIETYLKCLLEKKPCGSNRSNTVDYFRGVIFYG